MKWTSKHYAKWNRYKMLYLIWVWFHLHDILRKGKFMDRNHISGCLERQEGKEGRSEDWPQEGFVKIWGTWWKWTKSGLWWCWHVCESQLSCVQLFETPRTVGHQTPLSMGFSRQEYWSGLPCPPPGDLPDPGLEPESLVSCIGRQVLPRATWEAQRP